MIYVLFSNGVSVTPLFLPVIPQLALLLWTGWALRRASIYFPGFITLLILSFLLLTFMALIADEPSAGLKFIKLTANTFVCALAATALTKKYGNQFSAAYSDAMLVITIAGIVGLIIASLTSWHLTSFIGERQYHTNLMTTWITDGSYNSSQTLLSPFDYRLQVMFDEPGTYGILLLPAFFYFVQLHNIKSGLIILAGVVLSESVNAIIFCILVIFYQFFIVKSKFHKLIYFLLFFPVMVMLWPNFILMYEVKMGLDLAYSDVSSVGTRFDEYKYLMNNWSSHFLPLQNAKIIDFKFPNGISSSYVNWLLEGGVIAAFVLLLFFVMFFKIFRDHFLSKSPDCYFSVVLMAAMLLSGFQRSSFLDNVLFMTLTFWAVLYSSAITGVKVQR